MGALEDNITEPGGKIFADDIFSPSFEIFLSVVLISKLSNLPRSFGVIK